MEGGGDWRKVPTTIPVIIFALVYHDVIPGKIILDFFLFATITLFR